MKISRGHRSRLLALGVVLSVTLAVLVSWAFAARRPRRPNIILISIDTLRADHLESYGYLLPTSPSLARFRADAILFEEVIAQASSTLPSHASIFTSMIPQHHGASHTWNLPLSDAAVTLAEVLHAEGYRTLAVVGGGQLTPVYGLGQGFDVYDDLGEESSFGAAVRRGLDRIASGGQEPFFLFLHSYEVHHPYTPAPWRLAPLDSGYSGSLPNDISIQLLTDINEGRRKINAADLQHIVHAYDAEIASMDQAFGDLVAALTACGLYRDMLLVFTSDHGEEFGEHGFVGWHSHTLYEELLHVPLLIKLPRSDHAGATVSAMVRSLDIAPTVLAVVGVTPPTEFEGLNLLPLLAGSSHRPRTAVFWRETMPFETGIFSGIRVGHWKLHGGHLYDLQADPGERHDLADLQPELHRELETRLSALIESRSPLRAKSLPVDQQTRQSLHALGYAH